MGKELRKDLKEIFDSISLGNIGNVQKIIDDNPNFDELDTYDRNVLHEATIKKQIEILKLLLKYYKKVNERDNAGFTPLHYAAQENLPEIAGLLIQTGADVNIKDNHGQTPLARAVYSSRGKGDLIDLLLSNGADPNIKNNYDVSALETARLIANFDIMQFFHNKGFH